MGFSTLINYSLPDDSEILDLTWMRPNDFIKLHKNSQHKFIKEVSINIDNLYLSTLVMGEEFFNDIKLIINCNNTDLSLVKQARALKDFIRIHKNCLSGGVQLNNFDHLTELVLGHYIKNNGTELVSDNPTCRSKNLN